MIEEGIRDYLNENVDAASIGIYDFGSGAAKAIFTATPLPSDDCLPAIVVQETGGTRWGVRARKGAIQTADVAIYGPKRRSAKGLRDLAYAVWLMLERARIELHDACSVMCIADPPSRVTDPDGFPGFRIGVVVWFLEVP